MKLFKTLLLLTISLSISMTSCKKDEDEPVVEDPKVASVAELGANDETARLEYDRSMEEIFNALGKTGLQTGRASGQQSGVILPCGVIKLDSTSIPGVYKFVYDSTCGIRVLSGSISAKLLASPWTAAGGKLELTFNNYTILYTKNNQSLTFNGPLTITNILGGTIGSVILGLQDSIIHRITGVIDITFNAGDTRQWTITKERVLTENSGNLPNIANGWVFILRNYGQFAEVGSTVTGDPFTTDITKDLIYLECSTSPGFIFVAVDGTLVYTTGTESLIAEAGYQLISGNAQKVNTASKTAACQAEGYKLTYNILGRSILSFQYY